MPKITKKWNEDSYNLYFDNFEIEYSYIFTDEKNIISNKNNFILCYYKQNNTFVIFDENSNNIAGVFFTYKFKFDKVLDNSYGILIDNPVISKAYRGQGLCLWGYQEIHKFYKLPIVGCNSQTESILNSVWYKLAKNQKVFAKKADSIECVYNWNKSCINITHNNNSLDWYLIYEDK